MRFFSGIQPTGSKHFGNYSGGFRQYVAMQELGESYLCIVDLHSITVAHDPRDLHDRTLDLAAMLFAVGLDPSRSTVFVQSHVPAHAETAWLLSSVMGVGELRRMTQFKDKSVHRPSSRRRCSPTPCSWRETSCCTGRTGVPIGEDQRQHLELARRVADRFNARYGETFHVPEGVFPEVGGRIMDLQEPNRKMSTTGGTEAGTLHILDAPGVIDRKIKAAVTDAERDVRYDPEMKPSVSNLIEIMHVATGDAIDTVERRYSDKGYGAFKQDVADAVVALLEPFRKRYDELRSDEGQLRGFLAMGAERARSTSEPMVSRAYGRMGFLPP